MKKISKKLKKIITHKYTKRAVATIGGAILVIVATFFIHLSLSKKTICPYPLLKICSEYIYWTNSGKSADLFFELGNYNFGQGNYDIEKSLYFFNRTLSIDPSHQYTHYQLARIYFILGNQNAAFGYINKEIELYPDYTRSYYVRGLINGYSKNFDAAVIDFKTFLKSKPESWAGNNDLAWIYFAKGDFENAAKTAKEGLKIAPKNPWLNNSAGVALMNLGEYSEAKKYLLTAKESANFITSNMWGAAYPGNDPEIYGQGLDSMRQSIDENLKLIEEKLK